ncbi:MAG: sulfatase-like hydrolase/transferase, partial [Planctomycetota bacterium]
MDTRLNRRRFLQATGGALAAAAGAVGWAAAPKQRGRPNLLFLMTDEQHYRSLSITGNPYIETPHMDRIAREGAVFTNATCVTPYCSPSRASMITGVYPHTHRILRNVSPRRSNQPPLKHDAFPNTDCILRAAGYATSHRGKWHLGDKGDFPCYESMGYAGPRRTYHKLLEERLPRQQFADHKDPGRYLGRPVAKIGAIRRGWQAFHDIPNNHVAYIATIGRTVIPPELLPETQISNQVLGLIDQHKDGPFMITASWSPPHDLWVIPEPYYSMVDRSEVTIPGTRDLPLWDQRGPSKRLGDIMGDEGIKEYIAIYHGMVKYIDDQVGRILGRLDDLGLGDNTLVIFTSDHGDMAGAHGCIGKSIGSFFDDLVRIPLAMRFPGRIRPGTVVDAPVSQIDYMPTLLDYLGQPVPEDIHGRSMRPLVEGRGVAWRDHA